MSLVVPSLRGIVASPPWAKNELWRKALAAPTLDLRFADSKSLTDAVSGQNLIDFTRSGDGTYVDSDRLIKVALADVPRFDHDPVTGESLGLLIEEQRTNFALSSATFQPTSGGSPAAYVVDQVAPDGTISGSRQTAAAPRTLVDYYLGANAQYTFSVYVKGVGEGIDQLIRLQLKNAASDTVISTGALFALTSTWTRISVTGTTNGATTGARVEVLGQTLGAPPGTVFWGAQLEAGAFPTSYIPTTSAQVTRNADVASITEANFSSWYRQDEGTVFVDGSAQYVLNAPGGFLVINDPTGGNRVDIRQYRTQPIVQGGGSSVAVWGVASLPVIAANTFYKQGVAYSAAADSHADAVNGAVETSTTDIGNIAATRLALFMRDSQTAPTGGTGGRISRLTFFNSRLPDATLQAITSP